jgi:hypothetical protein
MRGTFIACGLIGGAMVLSLVWGQEPGSKAPDKVVPAKLVLESPASKRDLSKLSPLEQQAYLSGQRGAEWLERGNRADGRFLFGYLPALRAPMEGNHYLTQVEAAHALARAGRFYQNSQAAAIARQAILVLLLDTSLDSKSNVRTTSLPNNMVNRLAAAGLLILAIHELPDPKKDLLDQAGQLANFICKQQRADGSLLVTDGDEKADAAAINHYTGPALLALVRVGQLEGVRRARPTYCKWWQEHKNMAMIPWHTAAYAEAYLKTREQPFADAVFEMNDWLCALQHQQPDARHPLWLGGFKSWRDGAEGTEAPEAGSAVYIESLAQACRVARQAGDVGRFQRYREAAQRGLAFLGTVQYTEANTQHFADWYRPVLVGAFHVSHEDGNLRLDHTSRAVAALVQYLEGVAELH